MFYYSSFGSRARAQSAARGFSPPLAALWFGFDFFKAGAGSPSLAGVAISTRLWDLRDVDAAAANMSAMVDVDLAGILTADGRLWRVPYQSYVNAFGLIASSAVSSALAFVSGASSHSVPHATYVGPLDFAAAFAIFRAQNAISSSSSTRSVVPCRRCTRMSDAHVAVCSSRVNMRRFDAPGGNPRCSRSLCAVSCSSSSDATKHKSYSLHQRTVSSPTSPINQSLFLNSTATFTPCKRSRHSRMCSRSASDGACET
mmetsp:Transcript_3810/g.12688  ORF Transcript_3810/g.12688 Transcript_3810/m.12688 type:complete len:257 (-) Transcript_3810:1328-2098(-)